MMHSRSLLEARENLFRALADSTRLEILEVLAKDGAMNVSELCERLGKEQNLISHHLSCLRNCGLVSVTEKGRFAIYEIRNRNVLRLLGIADKHIKDILNDVLSCVVVSKRQVALPRAREPH
jgi:DNA-binding transcriptional ArsR family regulator